MSIDGFSCHLQSLACIKFRQIIVIFPPQTFTWGESQNPGGGTLNAEVIGMLIGNVLENPKKYPNCWRNTLKNTNFTENFSETSHFYSIWKMSKPKNTRISFLHKTFQKTLKNTRIRILCPKNTTSISITLPWKYNPRGAILTTVFTCRSFAFCMTKRLSPQVEVKSRKTKENGISHIQENGSHSSYEGNH